MSDENVELVRRYYEASNRGDDETVRTLLTEDFETDTSRRPVEPAVLHGREQSMAAAAAVREAWEELIVEPVELIPSGDRVLAIVDNRARGRASGAAVESRTAQLWTVRGGRLARFEYFGTEAEGRAAIGLGDRAGQTIAANIRELVAAINETGEPARPELYDPEVTFTTRGELQGRTVYRGYDGLRAAIADVGEAWAELECEPLEIIEGDGVAVLRALFHLRAHSGVLLDVEEGWVYRFDRGVIKSIEQHATMRQALDSAGLAG